MFRKIWNIFRITFSDFAEDRATTLAAALAFYAMTSLGPVLVIIIAVAGLLWGRRAAQGELEDQFASIVGPQAAPQVAQIVAAAGKTSGGVIATAVSVVIMIVAATGVFSQLRSSLNVVWDVEAKPKRFFWGLIKDRLLAFGVVLLIAVLLLASLVATTIVANVAGRAGGQASSAVPVSQIIEFLISWAVVTVLFAMIFKWLPEVVIQWRVALFGGVITGLLFCIGKVAIGWYLGRGSVSSVYGAAGSLVAILLWVYYSSIILLFGAELTQAYARVTGKQIKPSVNAVPISEAKSCQQDDDNAGRTAPRTSAPDDHRRRKEFKDDQQPSTESQQEQSHRRHGDWTPTSAEKSRRDSQPPRGD